MKKRINNWIKNSRKKYPITFKIINIPFKLANIAFTILNWSLFPLYVNQWKKRLVAFALATTALTIGGNFLSKTLPDGKEFLEQEGLNPKILHTLAPNTKIRVHSNTLGVTLSSLREHYHRSTPVLLMPIPLHIVGSLLKYNFLHSADSKKAKYNIQKECIVTIPQNIKTHDVKNEIFMRNDQIKHIGITSKELFNFFALHEMRHCVQDADNITDLYGEADADFEAAKAAVKEFNNPEIMDWVLHWRAINTPEQEEHDVALILDAKIRGVKIPTKEEVYKANKEAAEGIKIMEAIYSGVSTQSKLTLSGLAYRRIQLQNEARAYFSTPKENTPKASKKSVKKALTI